MIDIKLNHRITKVDLYYLTWLKASLDYFSPKSQLMVRENSNGLIVHITPGNPQQRQDIVLGLLDIHRPLGIKLEYSKSLAISKKISYNIPNFNTIQTNKILSL